ncbi:MAG: GGDEF domain-containing protein [Terracidiphilus sp.]|jgi:diguanylate cyclase
MSVDEVVKSRTIADSALATMQRLEVPASPANYAIWYEYHAGQSPNLQRTIDVLISNDASFNESTLQDLYATFFSSAKEAQAVRETSMHALKTLQEIVGVADLASDDAHDFGNTLRGIASNGLGRSLGNLKNLIEDLVEETQSMAGRSEYVGLRMRESAGKIEALERNLENAILDSTLDGLTGVSNRRAFDNVIRRLAGEAMNSGDDLAMLMIDIDHFKRVNDTWGHQTGDTVLRYLAMTLQKAVRGGDHVARYGGEEFAVILPRTDGEAAVSVAENIRTALAKEPLTLDVTPPLTPITVSIGAACYEPGDPLADWVGRADAALYSAKRDGRDRVELN